MKSPKLQLAFCLLILVLNGCGGNTNNGLPITREDRSEIVRLSLERALVDQEIPDYGLIHDAENIILSTANIDASLVPTLPGINLVLMTREEIQYKADGEGDFLYIEFTEFNVESDTKVTVSLNNTWAVAARADTAYLSGGGFVIEFTRSSDGWIGEVGPVWMS